MDQRFQDHGKAARLREILKSKLVISKTQSGRWWIVSLKQHHGGPHEVRKDDSPGEDRSDERLELEWRYVPRLLLIALGLSLSICAFLGTACVGLVVDRFRLMESAQRDPLWDLVGKISQTQAEQGVRIRQHDDALRDMTTLSARMFDVQTEVRILNERLRRKGL